MTTTSSSPGDTFKPWGLGAAGAGLAAGGLFASAKYSQRHLPELQLKAAQLQTAFEASKFPMQPGLSAEDALRLATERYGGGQNVIRAETGAGDVVDLVVNKFLNPVRDGAAAKVAAVEGSGKMSSATFLVGDWKVPAMLDNPLRDITHSEYHPITTTTYVNGHTQITTIPNWENVTYSFDRFSGFKDGVDTAYNGVGELMRNEGSFARQAASNAADKVATSAASIPVKNILAGVALVAGVGLLGYGIYRAMQASDAPKEEAPVNLDTGWFGNDG